MYQIERRVYIQGHLLFCEWLLKEKISRREDAITSLIAAALKDYNDRKKDLEEGAILKNLKSHFSDLNHYRLDYQILDNKNNFCLTIEINLIKL